MDAGPPPTVWFIQRWDGKVVASTSRGYLVVDPATGETRPLTLAGCAAIEWLDERGAVALCRDGARRRVLRRDGTAFDVPSAPRDEDYEDLARVAADQASIVVATAEHVFWHRDGVWTTYRGASRERRYPMHAYPPRMLVRGGVLVGGWNAGEFGGGLATFDRGAGRWLDETPGEPAPNVNELLETPDGKLWFVAGLAHLGLHGAIGTLHDHTIDIVAGVDKYPSNRGPGWWRPEDAFEAAAVDTDGALIVLTVRQGLFRYAAKRWIPLTPKWTDMNDPSSIVLDGNTVLVANQAGVGVVDRDTGAMRWQPLP